MAHQAGTESTDPCLTVFPLWFTPQVGDAAAVLRTLGLVERISSADQNWIDLCCPGGGLVGVHQHDRPSVDLSFEYSGDLDALQQRVAAIDPAASIIDGNYARVLRISDPDGGPELWINARQDDLYGFRRHPG